MSFVMYYLLVGIIVEVISTIIRNHNGSTQMSIIKRASGIILWPLTAIAFALLPLIFLTPKSFRKKIMENTKAKLKRETK